ncbi:hypothetical protein GCM10029976_031790 [Kribbella albertanoniae]
MSDSMILYRHTVSQNWSNLMAEPTQHPDPGGAASRPRPAAGPPRAPRWVKISAIVVAILILAAIALKLSGAGDGHGPGRHTGTAPFGVTAIHSATDGHACPAER